MQVKNHRIFAGRWRVQEGLTSGRGDILRIMLQDAAGARTCFVDTSVYSRNRAFRLYLSSKAGKKAVLQPTGARAGACASCGAMRFDCPARL